MACDCISKSEAKTREYLKEQHPEWDLISGSYNNKTFIYEGPKQGIVMVNEFEALYTTMKADGTKTTSKKHILQMFGQFCPFCGKKMVEDKEGEVHGM